MKNWGIFSTSIGFGSKGNKEKKTEWLVEVGDIRNTVMHPSRREYISFERLQKLRGYRDQLKAQLAAVDSMPLFETAPALVAESEEE